LLLFLTIITGCQKEDLLIPPDEEYFYDGRILKSGTDGYAIYYSNELFVREAGKPVIITRNIGGPLLGDFTECLKLHVKSGSNGSDYVSSAVLKIDGIVLLSSTDFTNSEQEFTFDLCNLNEASVLELVIYGTPGSVLEIWIDGTLNKGTFIDPRDGHEYKWVRICDKIWMAENLAYLPNVSPSSYGSDTDPYYYVYDYEGWDVYEARNSSNFKVYGVLYNWPAAQTAAPEGWHLPSASDYESLINCFENPYVAYENLIVGGSSNFNAIFPGIRNYIGGFFGLDYYCDLQTTNTGGLGAIVCDLNIGYQFVYVGSDNKARGFTVRCIKD
jgi:uncharacterized protein (TIGR02145 family)